MSWWFHSIICGCFGWSRATLLRYEFIRIFPHFMFFSLSGLWLSVFHAFSRFRCIIPLPTYHVDSVSLSGFRSRPGCMHTCSLAMHMLPTTNCLSSLFVQFTSWGAICLRPTMMWNLGDLCRETLGFPTLSAAFLLPQHVISKVFCKHSRTAMLIFALSWPTISYDHVEFGVN